MKRICPRCGTTVDEERIKRAGRPVGTSQTPVEVRRQIADLAQKGFSNYTIRKTLGVGLATAARFRNWTE